MKSGEEALALWKPGGGARSVDSVAQTHRESGKETGRA